MVIGGKAPKIKTIFRKSCFTKKALFCAIILCSDAPHEMQCPFPFLMHEIASFSRPTYSPKNRGSSITTEEVSSSICASLSSPVFVCVAQTVAAVVKGGGGGGGR